MTLKIFKRNALSKISVLTKCFLERSRNLCVTASEMGLRDDSFRHNVCVQRSQVIEKDYGY